MKYLIVLLLLILTVNSRAQSADDILGVWLTGEGNGHVEIYRNGPKYQGKIVWLKEPTDPKTGKPRTDVNHPDQANHTRPILGLVNLWGFTFKGKNEYENGRVYDPKNGKEYKCVMTLKDKDHLDVRGYVGISMIGRTDRWTRVK
ncbi:MAG TPA: DUF2147 domain-containing protein [Chitinophagaceae bacterium]|nr:DUF2147 domain-containing protein [Chitinophagaceae bacterium]